MRYGQQQKQRHMMQQEGLIMTALIIHAKIPHKKISRLFEATT